MIEPGLDSLEKIMNKSLSCLAALMVAATSAFGQLAASVPYDDDGYPFQLLAMPGEAPDMVSNDDDGNPIELLPLDMTAFDLADRSSVPSMAR